MDLSEEGEEKVFRRVELVEGPGGRSWSLFWTSRHDPGLGLNAGPELGPGPRPRLEP